VNEKGLSIGVLQLDVEPTHQDNGHTDITTSSAIRLILDRAATVDEAVELLRRYDMHSSANACFHFQIADRLYIQTEAGIEGQGGEHMVKKADAGIHLHLSPVQAHRQGDIGLLGFAGDDTTSWGFISGIDGNIHGFSSSKRT
jgi:hypothetical protein